MPEVTVIDKKDAEERRILKHIYDQLNKNKDMLQLMAEGYTTKEIAKKLFKGERTIEGDIYRMTVLMGFKNKTHLVMSAARLGIIK